MLPFIDTHTHIYEPCFDADREAVIERAREAGALCLLLPNVSAETIGPMLDVCAAHPRFCLPMMGLQPEELPADPPALLAQMRQRLYATPDAYCAVGEVGLDYYWDASRRTEQLAAFAEQLRWAADLQKPLSIHARAAHADLVATLRPLAAELAGGVFHCFGGTADEARELLRFEGFCLGLGGVLTFKKSTLPDVLREAVPLSRIVVETDAPYLTPAPHRGQRNEPAFVPHILARLADVYGVTPDEAARQTTDNARRVFRL